MKADQLSQTAAFVAVKFYGMTRMKEFRSLFDDSITSFYDRLVQTLPAPIRYYHYWLQFKGVRKLYIWSEELMLPGDLLHVIARKWHIQQMVGDHVDTGYEQIIVLGAGFDHLGYYYTQKGVPCFEFDAPYMANLKRSFLTEQYSGQTHPKIINLHLPGDQIGNLLATQQDIDPQKKTIVVAEGFFDYLDANTVSDSLHQLNAYFSQTPALISTHFALEELSAFHRRVFKSSVQMVGESLQFNASMDEFSRLLESEGFTMHQLTDSQEIRDSLSHLIKIKLEILDGFYVLQAR